LTPPTAAHVLAVLRLIPRAYRLALLVLDATGMRIGELEGMVWGDVDEPAGRWRVRREVSKTRKPRWVPLADFPGCPLEIFDAVVALMPREDRDLEAPVLAGFTGDAFRTAIAKACKAAAVPLFSPHDLRHRRATLWHFQGVPHVQAAAWLGHTPAEYLKTYAHATLTERSEIQYRELLDAIAVRDFAA
jgi:integrase